ncbi:MAG: hypothetical protein AAF658_12325 [Myxococcota bacterium]
MRRLDHSAFLIAILAATPFSLSPAHAVVVYTDDFEDLDRDNDGMSDPDVGEPTVVGSPSGLTWLAINGGTGTGDPSGFGGFKPRATISQAGSLIGGITNNSLRVDSVGSNSELMARFPGEVLVGAGYGSRVTFRFDFQVSGAISLLPNNAEVRFGVFQDTDNQFGAAGPDIEIDGVLTPTVWGETDGDFDGSNPGSRGDSGFWVRSDYGVATQAGTTEDPFGDDTRVQENIQHTGTPLGSSSANYTDLLRRASDGFGVVDDFEVYTYELTMWRSSASSSGETMAATLRMIDGEGVEHVLTGQDGPADDHGPAPDSFEYFVIAPTTDADFLIDNVVIDVLDVSTLDGDFNNDGSVDAADYTVWRDNEGSNDETLISGAGVDDGVINFLDYNLWVTNYGNEVTLDFETANTSSLPPAAGGAVPEPSGLLAAAIAASIACSARWRHKTGLPLCLNEA